MTQLSIEQYLLACASSAGYELIEPQNHWVPHYQWTHSGGDVSLLTTRDEAVHALLTHYHQNDPLL